jgi:hypothetical protein
MYSRASVSRKFDEHCWGAKLASEKDVEVARTLQVHGEGTSVYGKGRGLAGALVVK